MLFELYDPNGWIAEWFQQEHALSTMSAETATHPDDRASHACDAVYSGLIVEWMSEGRGMIDMDDLGDRGVAYLRAALAEDGGVLHAAERAASATRTTAEARKARYDDMQAIIEAIQIIDELAPALAA